MKQKEGIWWTINQEKVAGKLEITEENKISLTTYGKLYDTNIIYGFAEGEKITLVDIELDRTDIYTNKIHKDRNRKRRPKRRHRAKILHVQIYSRYGHIWAHI